MSPEPCELVDLRKALDRFVFPPSKTQSSAHIIPLHWYVACRLVIEGGFDPEAITPRPPFRVDRTRKVPVLIHDPAAAGWGERTLLGGLKTKDMDVTVCLDGIGPVLAVSIKGTQNAFRNLTNRMEEAGGDCTNIHLAYPTMVYGFWHVMRANKEGEVTPNAPFKLDEFGAYENSDIAVTKGGDLSPGILRYANALERLSDRVDLRDSPSSYEACALTLVQTGKQNRGTVYERFPKPGVVLDYQRMFDRLYELYDRRYVFQAPSLAKTTARSEWRANSPILEGTICQSPAFSEMKPRIQW